MIVKPRLTAWLMAVLVTGGATIPMAARASEEGRRNTTLGLGALAGYLLLSQRNKLPGIVAAAGAAYAYKRYDDSIRDRHRRERYGYYDDGYYRNRYYNSGYSYRYRGGDPYYGSGYRYAGYRSSYGGRYYHHDNGRHLGWCKHGKHWKHRCR